MIIDELICQIKSNFSFSPTHEQSEAMHMFARFMTDRDAMPVMIMRGSAGTGKTSLASAIVRTMDSLRQKIVLLAPTGRAAKVFSLNSGHEAFTIHRRIYRQKSMDADGGLFSLNYNRHNNTLFIVDEASMIANGNGEGAFGSGHLLDDLIQFVFSGNNCRLMLIGDRAQLPPVGEEESPALSRAVLSRYGLKVCECDLNEVMRQAEGSGILLNATMIRQMITRDAITHLPKIRLEGFADVEVVNGNELIETLASSYSRVGIDQTTVITRSNKRANIYNQGIRNQVLGYEDFLVSGDILMIVKNNYFWVKDEAENTDRETTNEEEEKSPSFLANGDIAVVHRVRNVNELYGFHFADVRLTLPDYDDYELQLTLLTDTLTTEAPALPREQSEQLFLRVMDDYVDVPQKEERLKKLRADIHFNALQVKYAYAVTCHKAQGGQWQHVYVDQGYMTDDMLTVDYIHWLYTAFTRATEKLYLVNWPEKQIEEHDTRH